MAVSVIVPAFNAGRTVEAAVTSALAACSDADVEVVVVDDGSTDDTIAVLTDAFGRHSAVTVISHKHNRGGGAARNTAVMSSSNELIFCLDSDNLLHPRSLDKLVACLTDPAVDAAAFGELAFFKDNPDRITQRWRFGSGPITLAEVLSSPVVPPSSGNYLYRRSSWLAAGGYPEFAGSLDAWGFGLRQVALGHRLLVRPQTEYLHRVGHSSYWIRDKDRRSRDLSALQLLLPYLDQLIDEDQAYVLSPENRTTWFDSLEERPLRVRHADLELKSQHASKGRVLTSPAERAVLKAKTAGAKARNLLRRGS